MSEKQYPEGVPCGDHERRLYTIEEWIERHNTWAGIRSERLVVVEGKADSVITMIGEIKRTIENARNYLMATLAATVGYLFCHVMGWVK